MSGEAARQPKRKHRHDIGEPDHAAVSSERVTRALQFLLGAAILATAVLTLWTLVVSR